MVTKSRPMRGALAPTQQLLGDGSLPNRGTVYTQDGSSFRSQWTRPLPCSESRPGRQPSAYNPEVQGRTGQARCALAWRSASSSRSLPAGASDSLPSVVTCSSQSRHELLADVFGVGGRNRLPQFVTAHPVDAHRPFLDSLLLQPLALREAGRDESRCPGPFG